MKKILLTVTLLAGAMLGGCTLTETCAERHRRHVNICAINSRELVEEWDYFWLCEKPNYLTPWHIAGGLP